eukprot:TRINITY_DN1902_c0_g1_i1.p1 TRINITY_DN1902_c0_g1~~TRINITY_DN1902_c0_g1_i1.p1  ORF type:complete len:219 (-),score=59.74 TRINITY_DN1902_c0_g1_i1:148-804(-)
MKATLLVLFFAVFVAVVVAQPVDQQHCTGIPSTFNSRVHITTLDDDECVHNVYDGFLFYDYASQFTRVDLSIQGSGYSVYSDYAAGVTYVFDRTADTCDTYNLDQTLSPSTFPNNTVFLSTAQLGTETLEVFSIPAQDGTGEIDLTVSQDGCYLISVNNYNYTTNAINVVESFYDFFPDLPFNVFALPSECTDNKKAKRSVKSALSEKVVRKVRNLFQ